MAEGVDFVIITALEEEREAVLKKLSRPRRHPVSSQDIHVYYSARIPVTQGKKTKGSYRVIVLSLPGMGRVQAATTANDAIRRWKPSYVMMVGIAGGVAASGVKVGDVLIADQVADYELQKLTPKGPQIRWKVHPTAPRLITAVQNLRINWHQFISVPRPTRGTPTRHIGPIASGDKVIATTEVLSTYQQTWPKLVGVEMEAGGVAVAAFQAAAPANFFMIRGVSDLADEHKGTTKVDRWRAYACDVAAAYTIALLQSGPIPLRAEKKATGVPKTTRAAAAPRSNSTIPIPHIKRPITQLERDTFLTKSFESIKRYFRTALTKLQRQNQGVKTALEVITSQKFVCKVYVNRELKNQCKIWIGGSFGTNSIQYLEGLRIDVNHDNSSNDSLMIEDNGVDIYLRASGMWFMGGPERGSNLTAEQAAAYLWTRLTTRL